MSNDITDKQRAELSAERLAEIRGWSDGYADDVDFPSPKAVKQLLGHITYLNRRLAEAGAKIIRTDNRVGELTGKETLQANQIKDLQAENRRLRDALEVAR